MGWTEHTHVPAPVVPVPVVPVPAAPPVQPSIPQNYVPFQSTVVQQQGTTFQQAAPAGPISNRSAWLSLGLGAFAAIFVGIYLETHPNGIVVTSAAATSIFWGIRAIIHRRQGRATVLWAPIVGIALGALSVIFILLALLGALVSTAGTDSGVVPQSQSSGVGTQSFPNNPELTALLSSTDAVERALQSQHAVSGTYPASVSLSSGALTLPDGTVLATIQPTWGWQYVTKDNGASYSFELVGTKGGNRAGYSSIDDKTLYDCDYKDCNVNPDTQPAQTAPAAPNA
ncbi:MAG: hypothetical protein JWN36_2775 [Microbacteriaceae bacterium]|nr:hypothetical protein [Microbacteriaceae bacterium]